MKSAVNDSLSYALVHWKSFTYRIYSSKWCCVECFTMFDHCFCTAPVKKTIEAESLKEGILLAMKVTKVIVCTSCVCVLHALLQKGISKGGVILQKKV